MTTTRQDYFSPGTWNAVCDRCGAKLKASQLTKDWQGFMLCSRCWEPRHPQDFVRARPTAEPAPVPFVRPPATPDYVAVCSMIGRTGVVDDAVVDCSIVDYTAIVY